MNNILREFRAFSRAYIDDVVVFSKTLEDHCRHLHAVFTKFQDLGISLKPTKALMGYPLITLLGQNVDDLGPTINEDRIRALKRLQFPRTLSTLKRYLGLTGWLRNFIPYYAQSSAALQTRKKPEYSNGPYGLKTLGNLSFKRS